MNRSSAGDEASRRIGLFCSGVAISVFFGVVAFGLLAFISIPFYPDLTGNKYWAEIGKRLYDSTELTITMAVLVGFVCFGLGIVVWAVVGRRSRDCAVDNVSRGNCP